MHIHKGNSVRCKKRTKRHAYRKIWIKKEVQIAKRQKKFRTTKINGSSHKYTEKSNKQKTDAYKRDVQKNKGCTQTVY